MNRTTLAVAAALAVATGSTWAAEAEPVAVPDTTAQSRQQVRSDLREWRDAGASVMDLTEASPTALDVVKRDEQLQPRVGDQMSQQSAPDDALDPLQTPTERMADTQRLAPGAIIVPPHSIVIIETPPASNVELAPQMSESYQHPAVPRPSN